MKKFAGIFLLSVMCTGVLLAEPVAKKEVLSLAQKFVELYNTHGERTVSNVITYELENGESAYHFVILEPTGWVLVSADDVLTPVIGYSFENQFVPKEQWEESALVWFDKIDKHIFTALQREDLLANKEWKEIYNEEAKKSVSATAVEPFIPVNWNQSSGWNRFCPEDEEGPGGHAYVGCVAVSMAQAMSVFKYPAQPTGEKGYTHNDYGYIFVNYNNQPPYNWSSMSNTSSDDENARLLYHLAVAVEMGFGPDGSGAYTSKAPSVLKSYFGYSESLNYKYRSSYSDADWKQMVIDELVQGRPLIYSGDGNDGQAGHAFNVDGVGADGNYFHLNWGWSGSNNGYFTLDALSPGSYNFSYDQAAVFGIKPPSAGPYDITLSKLSVNEKQPIGTFVSKVDISDEFDDNSYVYELKGRFNVLLDDYGSANFYIENDSLKTLKEFDYNSTQTEPLIIEVTDQFGNFFTKKFEIAIDEFYFGPTAIILSDTTVEEGKNPGYFTGLLTVEDDIALNTYSFSCKGGYDLNNLTDKDCFVVRNDSLFTGKTFYKSDGLTYYLQITVNDNNDHSYQEVVTISITDNQSGTAAVSGLKPGNLRIFPNPAANSLTIIQENYSASETVLQLYTISGALCMSRVIDAESSIDLSHFSSGIYLLVLRHGDYAEKFRVVIAK